jgi:Phage terminase large subunit gpA, ATPase domain
MWSTSSSPLFAAKPALRGLIVSGRLTGRSTLARKTFNTGATLKILSARAPRWLRRHDFKVLYYDEITRWSSPPRAIRSTKQQDQKAAPPKHNTYTPEVRGSNPLSSKPL